MNYVLVRRLCSFFSGLILSQAGSLIQIGTRNILSSPSTLGIEGLSVLWILCLHVFALTSGIETSLLFLAGLPVFVVVGLLLARLTGKDIRLESVLFVGLTFNLLVGAIFSLWQFFFLAFNLPFPMEIWFGHFRYVQESYIIVLFVFEVVLLIFLRGHWRNLSLYTLGSTLSRAFGADLQKLYKFLFIFAVCGTYLVLAMFGAFSFLGLLFPLVARKLWFDRFDLKGELAIGAVVNGLAFMVIDFLCYKFPVMGAEIPVGLIASVVGAVCLIGLIWRSTRGPEFLANTRK
ncbi:MAG: iron chelate uptake ABC transporter family permease subunit [Bacteriovoracaceae bacterium]